MRYRILAGLIEGLERDFSFLDGKQKAEEFIKAKTKLSLAAGGAFFLLWGVVFSINIEGLAASSLVCAGSFFYFLREPKRLAELEAKKIEAKLPFCLLHLGAELNSGRDFDGALEEVAGSDYGALSEKLSRHIRVGMQSGKSVKSVLFELSLKTKSRHFARGLAQIISVYENVSGKDAGETIKRIGLELLARQKAEMKEFSAKLSVFSLLFIAVAAILPALFQSFVTIGSGFMEIPFTALELLAISSVGFPLLDAGILLLINSATPEFMKG